LAAARCAKSHVKSKERARQLKTVVAREYELGADKILVGIEVVAIDSDQVCAVSKRKRFAGKSGQTVGADLNQVEQLRLIRHVEQRQQRELRHSSVGRAKIGQQRQPRFAVGLDRQRGQQLDGDRSGGNGLGVVTFDMPIRDDRMRGRFAVHRQAVEIRDDLFHQVEVGHGRMSGDMIAWIERVGAASARGA
jgi:hypothetical protein